jgi:hypothetical protein
MRGVVRKFLHLPGRSFDQSLLPVAERNAPQARHRLEVFLALGIRHPYSASAFDHDRTALQVPLRLVSPCMTD